MAINVLEAFIIKFGLDSSGYEEGERDINERSRRIREDQGRLFSDIEDAGKKTGQAIKGLSREVVGLGLAFMGARSITGLITGMMTGAASADRFGERIGVATQKIYAWRKASVTMGGEQGDGDAALAAVQNIKMGLFTGQPDTQALGVLARLGISAGDLRNGDAGSILQKLAGAKGNMDPQLYASLLQQIGLPASTINFLMQGKESVDALIEQYAANSSEMESLAKEQEKLQKAMVDLQTTLANKIAPALTTIADWLNDTIVGTKQGPGTKDKPETLWSAPGWFSDLLGIKRDNGGWSVPKSMHDITMMAESGGNPNAVSSKGARGLMQVMPHTSRDPGFGIRPSNGSKADDVRVGREYLTKMMERYGGDPAKAWAAYNWGPGNLDKALKNYGGNWFAHAPSETRAYVRNNMEKLRRGGVNPDLVKMQRSAAARAPVPFQSITVNGITIHTKATDAKGIARDIHGALNRRAGMVSADRVVNP